MAKSTNLTYAFNDGEKSKAGLARIDQQALRLAAEIQENLMPRVQGEGQVRPGLAFIGEVYQDSQCRMIPFMKAVDDTSLLELTAGYMRVWKNDALISRASVSCSITNGTFGSASGWTLSATSGCTADINTSAANALYLAAVAVGGTTYCTQAVSTASAGTSHALRIVVTQGKVQFRVGSSLGAQDYIKETTLDIGTHSIAFTPTGTFYPYFYNQLQRAAIVSQCTIESAGTLILPGPWAANELSEIRYDQSEDVVYMTHDNWRQRKIQRRDNDSWSVVGFYSDDGPFTLTRTANIKLKVAQTYGNTTLTADQPFFTQDHVGAMFRLNHTKFNATFLLGGENAYTKAWRVTGIKEGNFNDRNFSYTTTGTFNLTYRLLRSFDSATSGFKDSPYVQSSGTTTLTTPVTVAFSDTGNNDNIIVYNRIGINTGDYVSGNMTVAVQYDGYGGYGMCRVTSVQSTTVANIEVLEDFKNTTYTDDWQEGEWSDSRGWPGALGFFDGRLWFLRDDQFWASISDEFTSFTLDTDVNTVAGGDAGSIQKNIATGGNINKARWMLTLQRPIFGTDGAETSAQASSIDDPMTPSKCTLRDCSTQGVAPISPIKIDGRGLYVQRSLERVYELAFDYANNGYASTNIMRLNEDIGIGGIVGLAVSRQPDTYVWMPRADGQVPVLLYEPKEKISGFIRLITDGASGVVEDVITLPGTTEDRVYFVVNRNVGGTKRYIEKLALMREARGSSTYGNKMADCHVYNAGSTSSVTLAHLPNQTGLVGSGFNGTTCVFFTNLTSDSSGVVNLGGTYTKVCVGLPYKWRYKSARLAYGTQQGTPIGQPKAVHAIGLLLADFCPSAINYGSAFSTAYGGTDANEVMYGMPTLEGGVSVDFSSVQSVYDEQTFPFGNSDWNTDSRICMAGSAPYPARLLGIVIDMQTNE